MLPYRQEETLAQHSYTLGLIQYFLQHESFFFFLYKEINQVSGFVKWLC